MPKKRNHLQSVTSLARLDHERAERTGIPEAVLGGGKTAEQIASLCQELAGKNGYALVTRVSSTEQKAIARRIRRPFRWEYHKLARVLVVRRRGYQPLKTGGCIAVLAAGTSDVPVAEEARVTAELMGCEVLPFYDVGVAGIHRLVTPLNTLLARNVSAVVAVAGMEGALPTVVRGLVPVPVIGVPTSVGYGYGGGGKSALMTMLQSCAPGLTVVNIDNGFGAGATAALIANGVAAARGNSRSIGGA